MNCANTGFSNLLPIQEPFNGAAQPLQRKCVAIKYFDLFEDLVRREPHSFGKVEVFYAVPDGVKLCTIEATEHLFHRLFRGSLIDRQRSIMLMTNFPVLEGLKNLKIVPGLSDSEQALIWVWNSDVEPAGPAAEREITAISTFLQRDTQPIKPY